MSKEKKRLYEGMYIISASLSEDARKKALDKILDGINNRGGEMHKIIDMGRRKLAYPIKGKKEGFYFLLYFSLMPSVIKELWNDYHLHEDLLRYMTMQTEAVRENLEFKPIKTAT